MVDLLRLAAVVLMACSLWWLRRSLGTAPWEPQPSKLSFVEGRCTACEGQISENLRLNLEAVARDLGANGVVTMYPDGRVGFSPNLTADDRRLLLAALGRPLGSPQPSLAA